MQKQLSFIRRQGVIIMLVCCMAIIIISTIMLEVINDKRNKSSDTVEHTYDVLMTAEKLLSYIKDGETGQRGFLLLGDPNYLLPYTLSKTDIREALNSLKEATKDHPEQQEKLDSIHKLINLKYLELQTTIDLRTGDSTGLARALDVVRSDKGRVIMEDLRKKIREISAVEKNFLEQRLNEQLTSERLFTFINWASTFLMIVSLVLGIGNIRQTRRSRAALYLDLDTKNMEYLFNSGHAVDTHDEKAVVDRLIDNIQNATAFIKHTGEQRYHEPYQGLSPENETLNRNNLAGALIEMRARMKQVSEEEQKRAWSTEGLARFSQLLRANNKSMHDLYFELISSFTKYMKANQAALFILNEKDPDHKFLELVSCYAYERKKYIDITIKPGEGLVGQAFLEKESTYLTVVPQDYIKITSGLGDATPGYLLIVPLVLNDQALGVMEIASFRPFAPHEIEFAEKLNEGVAATIAGMKASEHTRRLLTDAQERTQELKATEEEMRQNIEELAATQEEMHRKEKEYLKRIHELEHPPIPENDPLNVC